jgi:nucleoside-diphosphate-sugar epimerase
MNVYPDKISGETQLEELLSHPGDKVTEMFSRLDGDIMFLGISGKIGPTLALMAKRACDKAGVKKRIVGVSMFESDDQRQKLEKSGIETIHGNLLDMDFLKSLPVLKNVYFLAGMKFGSLDNLALTWAVNSFLPALVAEHFNKSRIVAFSTGCVYQLVPVVSGGSLETDVPLPVGEYAQSCLGRERMFEYGSKKNNTKVSLIRLNYSVELRYGVLVDIAIKVRNKQAVELDMGYFNVIWQGDVNDMVLRSIELASSPAVVLNLTGPEILSVREVATEFARLFGTEVHFSGKEATTALLSNSGKIYSLLGTPEVPASRVVQLIAGWIKDEGKLLGKPTHFEVRDGKY